MAVTGKTGADAIFKAVKHVAIVISHYAPKFLATVSIMEGSGALSATEAVVIREFITSLNDLVSALSKLADYSGF